MGDHYVPQYYLKGFTVESNSNLIYRYQKGIEQPLKTQIKGVAQENNFYSKELESYLNLHVEGPANNVLEKIRAKQPITFEDKAPLANYMMALMKRVPDGHRRFLEMAPKVLDELFGELEKEADEYLASNPSSIPQVDKFRLELQRLRVEYEEEPPRSVWYDIIPPHTAPGSLAALRAMTWRFWVHDKKPVFLTNDNPVFFFRWLGIGKPDSEVSFPISKHITLWATWRQDLQEGYIPVKESTVREINRRTAQAATRYIFSAFEADWIPGLLNKKNIRLNRLV